MDGTDEILQRLHDSEINFLLWCFWDCGLRWALGDELNGWMLDGAAPTPRDGACRGGVCRIPDERLRGLVEAAARGAALDAATATSLTMAEPAGVAGKRGADGDAVATRAGPIRVTR